MTSIKSVAEKAGVSISTVSRVLNHPNIVKSKTKEKVYSTMRDVQYFPSKKNAKQNNIIGLAIPDVNIDFVGKLIRALEKVLEDTKYNLLLINMKKERQVSNYFRESADLQNIDAMIILSAAMDDESVDLFRTMNIPVVLVQTRCEREKSICTNNYEGGFNATQFLIDRGYKNISFIGWKPEDDRVADRFFGYKNAIEKAGFLFRPEMTLFDSLSIDGGYQATIRLFKECRPDAIFYACDSMSFGGYKYFKKKGIRIPEDIGIVGYDDLEVASVLGLTTMKQFVNVKARIAVSYLVDRLSGKIKAPLEEELCVSPRLVIRDSTK